MPKSASEWYSKVSQEVLEIHNFFVDWFAGTCPNSDDTFQQRMTSHFAPNFQLVVPSGKLISSSSLFQGMRARHGSNPDFRIEIRNVVLQSISQQSNVAIVTYEEWQKNADHSNPPNNGRISTAVFEYNCEQVNSLQWLHLHETWLPESIVSTEPFHF